MRGASHRPRLAVLLSGSGRTLENLLWAIADRALDAEIVAVVSSAPGVRGLEIAAEAGIPQTTIRRKDFPDDAAFGDAIYAYLQPHRPDLLILAGYLRRIPVRPEWSGRILNIHPALLGETDAAGKGFYGERVHQAVLAAGARESGASVHVVTDAYDEGPVIDRERVPVLPGDTPETLAARVFAAECLLYPRAIAAYLRDHPELIGRTT